MKAVKVPLENEEEEVHNGRTDPTQRAVRMGGRGRRHCGCFIARTTAETRVRRREGGPLIIICCLSLLQPPTLFEGKGRRIDKKPLKGKQKEGKRANFAPDL